MQRKNNSILINVPHSSTYIPPEELKYFRAPYLQHELDAMTDHYCDDLYDTGNDMICFPISRLVCDPERFRDDSEEIMASVGMGAVYTACSDGKELRTITAYHREEILVYIL
jgi:N-formylglutamate amidohydrolase